MRIAVFGILACSVALFCSAHGEPADAPTTAPTEIFLDGGKLVFSAPPELRLLGKRDDDRSAGFALGDNEALVTIIITPQEHAISRDLGPQLARLIGKTIREEAERGELDIIMQPRVVPDERFLVVVHDRFNTEERFGDRRQMYRAVGLYLCGVVATAFTEDEAQAKRAHDLASEMLLSLRINRPSERRVATPRTPATRPVAFENAGVRIIPPPDWISEANDGAASGVIVTYRDPENPANLIAVSVRQLPAEARRDSKLRDIAVDEIVNGERQSFKIDGAQIIGQTRTITDRRFLRKTRTDYHHEDTRFRVSSRQIRAGDVIASVTIVAMEVRADEIDALADRIALDIRPLPSR